MENLPIKKQIGLRVLRKMTTTDHNTGSSIFTYTVTLRELLQILEGQICDCSEVISETQVQLFR